MMGSAEQEAEETWLVEKNHGAWQSSKVAVPKAFGPDQKYEFLLSQFVRHHKGTYMVRSFKVLPL